MSRLWIVLLTLAAVLIQAQWVHWVSVAGATPDLVVLVVIFLSLRRDSTVDLWAAFSGGVLEDLAMGSPLGSHALSLLGTAYLVGQLRRRFFQENRRTQFLVVIFFGFFHQGLIFFWINTVILSGYPFQMWLRQALGAVLYQILLAPPLFALLRFCVPPEEAERHLFFQRGHRAPVTPAPSR